MAGYEKFCLKLVWISDVGRKGVSFSPARSPLSHLAHSKLEPDRLDGIHSSSPPPPPQLLSDTIGAPRKEARSPATTNDGVE